MSARNRKKNYLFNDGKLSIEKGRPGLGSARDSDRDLKSLRHLLTEGITVTIEPLSLLHGSLPLGFPLLEYTFLVVILDNMIRAWHWPDHFFPFPQHDGSSNLKNLIQLSPAVGPLLPRVSFLVS